MGPRYASFPMKSEQEGSHGVPTTSTQPTPLPPTLNEGLSQNTEWGPGDFVSSCSGRAWLKGCFIPSAQTRHSSQGEPAVRVNRGGILCPVASVTAPTTASYCSNILGKALWEVLSPLSYPRRGSHPSPPLARGGI